MAEEPKITLVSIEGLREGPPELFRARWRAEWNKHSLDADVQIYAEDSKDASRIALHRFKRFLQQIAEAIPDQTGASPPGTQP